MKQMIAKYLSARVKKVLADHPLPDGWAWFLRSVRIKDRAGNETLRFQAEQDGKKVLDVEGAVFLPAPVSDEAVLGYLRSQAGAVAFSPDGTSVQLNGAQKAAWTIAKLASEQYRGGLRKAASEGRAITDATVQEYLLGLHSGSRASAPVALDQGKQYTVEDLIKLGVKVKVA